MLWIVFTWSTLWALRRWSENNINFWFHFKYNSFVYLKWDKCCKHFLCGFMKGRFLVPIHISWLSFMHQIGKSHTRCIIKVVLASLLSPVFCASFPNVDDHSGCLLTLINLAAHHNKPGVWWEMAKSAEESARRQATTQGLSVSCGDCCHCWSRFSTKVAVKTAISQICRSSKPGCYPERSSSHQVYAR